MLTRFCEKCGTRLKSKDDSVLCEDCKAGKPPSPWPANTSSEMPFVDENTKIIPKKDDKAKEKKKS